MMKINKTKTYVVKPAVKTPRPRSISLSLLDRLFAIPHYSSFLFIYRQSGFFDSAALRESLSKVLVHFYPMAGRYVQPSGEDDITEIDCNDEGVIFIEIESDYVIDDLGHLSPSSQLKPLIPSVDTTQRDISSYPLLLVQATYFRCGGVSLGVSAEHRSMDGFAAVNLMSSWSRIRRSLKISNPLFLDRTLLLCPRDPPQPRFDHQEYTRYSSTAEKISHQNTKISYFKFTKDQLKEMVANANQNQGTTAFTAFEVLAGHTWKCVCKARKVASDQDTRLMFTTNGRSNKRLSALGLPLGFLGNANFRVAPLARAGDLQSKPLWFAASTIHEALARIDDEYTRSMLDFLASQPDLSGARFGPHVYLSPNFHVTSLAGLGQNHVDFGTGPPIYSGPGGISFEKAFILSGEQSGDLTLAIALQPHHMEMFEKLVYDFLLAKL